VSARATVEGIPRADLDALAAESQARAERTIVEGRFERSLIPVHHPDDGSLVLDREEFPSPGTMIESLSHLAPSFPTVADYPAHRRRQVVPRADQPGVPDVDIEHVDETGGADADHMGKSRAGVGMLPVAALVAQLRGDLADFADSGWADGARSQRPMGYSALPCCGEAAGVACARQTPASQLDLLRTFLDQTRRDHHRR
jgi:acetyl-CoA acetyltransferase